MVNGDAKTRTQEERLRLVQLGEEKALGGPNSILPIRLLRKWSQALRGGVW